MDKKFLKESLKFLYKDDLALKNEFSKRIDNENFLKQENEIFTNKTHKNMITNFIVLKELTEKIRKVDKNFLYAFEIINSNNYMKNVDFGFLIKSSIEENTYIMFYADSLDELVDLYDKRKVELCFFETRYIFKNNKVITINNDVFSTTNINYFKNKFYYNIFKNEYLDHYLKENNLKIKNLVSNIFR